MPTGYTAGLTIESKLRHFAMACARNFGALLHMRDEPASAPVTFPEEDADPFYERQLYESKVALAGFESASDADRRIQYADDMTRRKESRARVDAEFAAEDAIYDRMLRLVNAWHPPTYEHDRLKDFMREQLSISKHGQYPHQDKLPEFEEWCVTRLKGLRESVTRAEERLAKQVEVRRANRKWWTDLLASLPE